MAVDLHLFIFELCPIELHCTSLVTKYFILLCCTSAVQVGSRKLVQRHSSFGRVA
jgi:hypothetical protein